jgi:Tfp pilus assembly protein PilX
MARDRGIALFIAMTTLVALAFVGIALVRAVTTSLLIGSNLEARRHATLAASTAFESGVVALFASGSIDTTADDVARNYFASRQSGEDSRGIPRALQSLANYPSVAAVIDAGDDYHARYVIERLCLVAGAAAVDHCTLSPPSIEAARGAPPPGEPLRTPYYRITVRVDGPAASATFVQGTLSDTHANPRLAWRVIDE